MKLFEYLAKDVFRSYGIPTPKGGVATSPEEAVSLAQEIGLPVVIKSQILAGGRGKAGGIVFTENLEEVEKEARRILGSQLKGLQVDRVLVEEKLDIDKELYLSITIDGNTKSPLILASSHGGVDIEEVEDEFIYKRVIDVDVGLLPYVSFDLGRKLGLDDNLREECFKILLALYKVFREKDAELVEINPLIISKGKIIALDARLNIDDDASYRQTEFPRIPEGTEWELKAKELGLNYVQLEGDIAVMANGAGITMATLDMLAQFGGKPANFLDAGGGASVEPMTKAIELLLNTKPKVIFINIFGGITRCDDVAKAIIKVKEILGFKIPLVIRLTGTREEEALTLLRQNDLSAYKVMEEAAKKAVEFSQQVIG